MNVIVFTFMTTKSLMGALMMSASNPRPKRQTAWLLGFTLFSLFFALGLRSLNEPDEGRYSVIAQEMLERKDWIVPHLWYAPHLDKPPFAYWAVATSLAWFGQSEWAVRLPLALAGFSGVLATFFFARSVAGLRAACWAAVILQTALLYYVMARMLTTDIFLAQFIAWGAYFIWRAWRSLDAGPPMEATSLSARLRACTGWSILAWVFLALAWLCKGPISLLIPMVALAGLLIYRRKEAPKPRQLLLVMILCSGVFLIIAAPWFLALAQRVPEALNYMIFGQAFGHALGTRVRDRGGHPLYFFAILAGGFIPWTLLLGWLWRRNHWRSLGTVQKEAWVFWTVWAVFTFTFFSFSRAKLPAYILPLFPPLSLLLAQRWFSQPDTSFAAPVPLWAWRACVFLPVAGMLAVPVVCYVRLHVEQLQWLAGQLLLGTGALLVVLWRFRGWSADQCAARAAALALINLWYSALAVPAIEPYLERNQTLKPLGLALRQHYRPGDTVVCWGRFPQGLPFYAGPVISLTNRPYLGGLNQTKVPFESVGNRDRLAPWYIKDQTNLLELLSERRSVWVIAGTGWCEKLARLAPNLELRFVFREGELELFGNSPATSHR